jgi:hypothetical protein
MNSLGLEFSKNVTAAVGVVRVVRNAAERLNVESGGIGGRGEWALASAVFAAAVAGGAGG